MALELEEKQAFDELAEGVKSLAQAVEDVKKRGGDVTIDDEQLARIAEVVLEKQKELGIAQQRRRSFDTDQLDDIDVEQAKSTLGSGEARLSAIQALAPRKAAALTRRPVDQIQEYHEACDNVALLGAFLAGKDDPIDVRQTAYYNDVFKPLMQAMDTATTAEGKEYVPRGLSASLIERVTLELRVAALFPLIPMPTQPFDVPGRAVGRQKSGLLAEATADTGQTKASPRTPATRLVTLTAKKFAVEALLSKELEEDAIIAMLPFVTEEIVDWLAADLEDAIINGDTAGTMDTGWASDDPRKNFDGIRKGTAAAFKTDVGNVAPTVALTIRANRKKMGKYGVDPNKLVHLASMSAYIQLLADANVITMEKYGPNATIVTGELGKADGSPIIVSEFVRQDLNATGVFDNVTTNRTEVVSVFQRGFFRGERRGLSLQTLRELYAESDQDAVLATLRQAFSARFPVATEGISAVAYNVAA